MRALTISLVLGIAGLAQAAEVTPPAAPVAPTSVEPAPEVAPELAPAEAPKVPKAPMIDPLPETAEAPPTPVVTKSASTNAAVKVKMGKGVTLTGDDLELTIRAMFQPRQTVEDLHGSEDPNTTFAARRMRLVLQGHALIDKLRYQIQLGFSGQDSETDNRSPLLDAYVSFEKVRDLSVRAGQMKVPFDRARVTSSSALELVDRAGVVSELNLDRDVGVYAFSKDLFGLGNKLGYAVGVFGGDGRNRQLESYGMLYVARLDFTPMGKFDDYVEGDLERHSTPMLGFGVAAAFNQHTNRPRSTTGTPFAAARFDYFSAEADAVFKFKGFALLGEVLYRQADEDSKTTTVDGEMVTETSRSAWGYYAEPSMMITDKLQAVARYGELRPLDGNMDTKLVKLHEGTAGLNYYFAAHNLKLQGDYTETWGDELADSDHRARVQMQLYF